MWFCRYARVVPAPNQYENYSRSADAIPHISLCFLTSLSSMVTNAFLVAASCSSFTNGGIVIDILPITYQSQFPPHLKQNIPKGPSICTVDLAAIGEKYPFFLTGGGRTLKSTPGGIDRGAFPICDAREGEDEKEREEAIGKAGRRNAGMEAEEAEMIALSSPLLRAVESMACMLCGLESS
jgi:hypothetical protein